MGASNVDSNAILDGSRFHCTIYNSLLLCRFVCKPKGVSLLEFGLDAQQTVAGLSMSTNP